MKTFLNAQAVLLLLCDIFLIVLCINIGVYGLFYMAFFNIFFGLAQFVPAIVLQLNEKYRTMTMLIYIIVSLILIGGVYVSFGIYEDSEVVGVVLMLVSYILAHAYIPIMKKVLETKV